jgi:hypothetical protein
VWEGNDGGNQRLKYHLAQIPGHEVGICKKATPEIIHIANKALDDMGIARDTQGSYESSVWKGRRWKIQGGKK